MALGTTVVNDLRAKFIIYVSGSFLSSFNGKAKNRLWSWGMERGAVATRGKSGLLTIEDTL